MHKVVVTGGLGFIGSHVVDALLADGREVTIIDSMVAAVTDGREYEPNARVHRSSIADYLAQGGSFKDADLVVQAASHVGPAGILKHQGNLGAEIVATTQEVIEECVEHDVALISFSSAEVYGRSGMLAESDDIIVPVHYNARLIHGPLYEEAESIQKLPVLDAAAAVGWSPRVTLDELIDETALYYRVRDDARESAAVPLDPRVRV